MKHRLIEVLLWIKNVTAVVALLFALMILPFIHFTESRGIPLEIWFLFLMIGVGILGALWIGCYVLTGKKASLLETLNMVFGKVPQYFWFIFTILYLGGLLSVVWSGTSDGAIWGSEFAKGVGAALGVLLIGSFGRLYSRNKLLGHIIGTAVVAIFALIYSTMQ